MPTAVPRPNYTPGTPLEDWFSQQLNQNSAYKPPKGWEVRNGKVIRTPNQFLGSEWLAQNPWAIPLMGIGAGFGASAIAGGGAAAGAGGSSTLPAVTSGLPGGVLPGTTVSLSAPAGGTFFTSAATPSFLSQTAAPGATTSVTPTAGTNMGYLDQIGNFFNKNKSLIDTGKGIISGISDRMESGAQRDFLQEQNEANRQMSREQTALNASQSAGLDPAIQRQKAALLMALLQGARNFQVTPPNSQIAATMPKLSGGLQIPEGGFSPETLAFLSPSSLRNQEQNYQQQIRSFLSEMPQVDLSRVGYPQSSQAGGPRAVPTSPNALQQALQMGSRRNPLRGGNV